MNFKLTFQLNFLLFFSIVYTKLLHVSILFRHGARTTGNFYELYKKYFLGIHEQELNPNGFTQEQLLGRYLRNRYIMNLEPQYLGFAKKSFDEESLQFKVSETQRTIFSSIALLSGIYPHSSFLIKKKGSNFTTKIFDL